MNLQELRTQVRNMLDEPDELQSFFSNSEIDQWINEGQFDIVRKTKCLKETATLTTETGVQIYQLPDDFIKEFRVYYNGNKYDRISLEEMEELNKTGYYIWEDDIKISASPDGGEEIKMWYYKLPSELINDTDIPDIPLDYHSAIVLYAVYKAKQKDRQFNEAQVIYQEYMMKVNELKGEYSNAPRRRKWVVKRW